MRSITGYPACMALCSVSPTTAYYNSACEKPQMSLYGGLRPLWSSASSVKRAPRRGSIATEDTHVWIRRDATSVLLRCRGAYGGAQRNRATARPLHRSAGPLPFNALPGLRLLSSWSACKHGVI